MDTYLQIANEIKKSVSSILGGALSGVDEQYRMEDGYIMWGLVESDIHAAIDRHLTSDNSPNKPIHEDGQGCCDQGRCEEPGTECIENACQCGQQMDNMWVCDSCGNMIMRRS